MVAGTRSIELRPIIEGAIALLALGALFRGLGIVIDNPMTSTFAGAVVVSFLLNRTGVPLAGGSRAAVRRALAGAGLAAGAVVLSVVAGLAASARIALLEPTSALVFGTAEAFASAFRDEIWLHGIPLAYAARARLPAAVGGGFAVAASTAAVVLEPSATPVGLAVTAAGSALFVVLWVRTRDGWAPIAGHFVWAWLAGALLAGELFDLAGGGRIVHGPGSSGALGWALAVAFAVAAFAAMRLPLPEARPEELEPPTT